MTVQEEAIKSWIETMDEKNKTISEMHARLSKLKQEQYNSSKFEDELHE